MTPTWIRDEITRPWALIAAAVVLAASLGVAVALALYAPPAHAAPASGRTCTGALTRGALAVTRTTGTTGPGRAWTSVTITSTGDPAILVTDRGHAPNRVARGASGVVTGTRSWGFSTRHPAGVSVTVAYVDGRTGRPGTVHHC